VRGGDKTIWLADKGYSLALEASGAAYVTGMTGSPEFLAVIGPDTSHNGYGNASVAKVGGEASVIYVPDDYPTIQVAVDAASPGDTIIVRDGTYIENVDVNKDHLTIKSENGAGKTIVQAANPNEHVFKVRASYVNINGFTVKGAGIGVMSSFSCTIASNSIYSGEDHNGIEINFGGYHTIINNSITGSKRGIALFGTHDCTIYKNIVKSCSIGIAVLGGVWVPPAIDNTIYLNDFTENDNNYYVICGPNLWNSPLPIAYTYNGKTYANHLGNHWSDYTGSDTNGDGIGDTPYSCSIGPDKDNYPLMEPFENYFIGTHAFDTCEAPDLSTMEAWMQDSPYRGIGIYIGGSSRTCPQKKLNRDWITQVSAQGWYFLPIWVGPQAPCTTYRNRFSWDQNEAYNQGLQEANNAIAAAQSLGLVNPEAPERLVIYYDLEAYDKNATPACQAAVESFLAGWVQGLKARGHTAGIYGSGCGSRASQWANLNPAPDAVWLASWIRRRYDPNVSVYGVSCVSDNLWNNHQRIRQYAGDHYETYGSKTMKIDSNREEGPIVKLGAMSAGQTLSALSGADQPVILGMDLLNEREGWLLTEEGLFWTVNGGQEWKNISPVKGYNALEAAFFLDSHRGWVMAHEGEGLILWRTMDGGQTWQSSPFPASWEGGSIFIQFVDAQNGWVMLKLPSGRNFSIGRLFRTMDGGSNWIEVEAPVGEPPHFVNASLGWIAGGPAGDELYVTRDGGLSWERQEIITSTGYVVYYAPFFQDERQGWLPVAIYEGGSTRVTFYATGDGGHSWAPAKAVAITQEVNPNYRVPVMVVGANRWVIADPAALPGVPEGATAIDFVSSDVGWMLSPEGHCQGTVCTQQTRLMRTSDGGQTWTQVSIPRTYQLYLPLVLRNYR
jgi:photosystem II stability/assembly factor-like uncharacterized protein